MRAFIRFADAISVACAVIASVMLFAAVLIVCWMVLYRALGHSTFWELETAVYLMVASVFLGSPYCLKTNGHVSVDLLAHYLPRRGSDILAIFIGVVGFVVCGYLTYVGAELMLKSLHEGETTGSLWNPPKWPLYLTMPLGLGLTALQYIAEILRATLDLKSAQEGA
ncbi:TRAP transporter small permease subunit [Pelomicrobium methylotrophicum]|uniref:TRAP transporter small permease protein n=1 Tax=Pelomicrobium methylotrophicum TaxID=2602750 RepID=A0A5C7EPI1_9PROT|nr:TRAP transporter small permease [Pelomicrobium methylotrophicum]TXF13306.1 TRAP transporter small permease [Pelomicrobium methylotrophicum]